MQYLAELLAAVTDSIVILGAALAAAILLAIVGAALRGRTPRLGAAVALLGLAIPVAILSGWLGRRGLQEYSMAGTLQEVKVGETIPLPAHVTVSGIANLGSGMVVKYGSVLAGGTFSEAVCYPLTASSRDRTVHIVSCAFGRSPGGGSSPATLRGVLGVRLVPESWRKMFLENTGYTIVQSAPILEEEVSPPTRTRGVVLLALAAGLAIGFLVLFVSAVRRRDV